MRPIVTCNVQETLQKFVVLEIGSIFIPSKLSFDSFNWHCLIIWPTFRIIVQRRSCHFYFEFEFELNLDNSDHSNLHYRTSSGYLGLQRMLRVSSLPFAFHNYWIRILWPCFEQRYRPSGSFTYNRQHPWRCHHRDLYRGMQSCRLWPGRTWIRSRVLYVWSFTSLLRSPMLTQLSPFRVRQLSSLWRPCSRCPMQ